MEWSTDLREYLKEICSLLSIPYSMLAARVDHRWLPSYDAAVTDEPTLAALTLLYYAQLSKEDKTVYKDIVQELKQVYNQIKSNTRQDLVKQNDLKKYTVFKQKTKLIVKTISKHLFVSVSANIREQQKEIERNYSALHEKSLTEAGRERKKRIAHK